MKKSLVLASGILAIILLSCSKNKPVDNSVTIIADLNLENKVSNYESTLRNNGGHSGDNYSSVDSVARYAIGYTYFIEDTLKTKNLMVYVSAWVRENEKPLTGGVAVALINSAGIQSWVVLKSKEPNYTPGQWVLIKDSLYFPAAKINTPKAQLAIMGIKDDGKDILDVDDLKIKYKFY